MKMTLSRVFPAFFALFAAVSCHNMDIEFDDYGMTTVCFPYQTPARSLILGRYDIGFNENDNNHRFEVGVSLSGVIENKEERKVYFEVDESLLNGVANVKALPSKYYTVVTENPVVIPEGSTKGRIMIQLTREFFDDPAAIAALNEVNYALPVRITGVENIDSVLVGIPSVGNPNRLKSEDWSALPKDYTLYGIKYINPYDGYFLRRGVDKLQRKENGVYIDAGQTVYRSDFVEKDELVRITTLDYTTATLSNYIRRPDLPNAGEIMLQLQFDEDTRECIVMDEDNNAIGTGEYVVDGDAWGGKSQDVIHIKYAYEDLDNGERHEVSDTLVMRDRNVVFEQFTVEFE